MSKKKKYEFNKRSKWDSEDADFFRKRKHTPFKESKRNKLSWIDSRYEPEDGDYDNVEETE